jgi:hypothetical protein
MNKQLYNEYEALNEEGSDLSIQVENLLKPIFIEMYNRGYSFREIGHVITLEVGRLECELVVRSAIQSVNSKE